MLISIINMYTENFFIKYHFEQYKIVISVDQLHMIQ